MVFTTEQVRKLIKLHSYDDFYDERELSLEYPSGLIIIEREGGSMCVCVYQFYNEIKVIK